jgi:FixJ family two-component response regulator
MSDEVATVYVVDDDASVRGAVCGILQSVGLKAKCFESAQDFWREFTSDGPACLVLDVRLPGLNGLEFQKELAKTNVAMPIIFITGYGDIPMSVRAMKAGAVEFLTKPFREQDLLDAIGEALKRARSMRNETAVITLLRRRFDCLTPREAQVMARVAAGQSSKEIATEFCTSEVTVKVQRSHVMEKMQAKSVLELVKMAEKLGLPLAKSP